MCLLFPGRYDTIFILNKEDHNMPNGKISEKQKEILEYIKQEILNKGYLKNLQRNASN